MKRLQVKIGHQQQANKPIYLLHDGSIVCGAYHYRGSHKRKFREVYAFILRRAARVPVKNVLDVSESKFWDAPTIFDEIISENWQKTISAGKIQKLANETEIRARIEEIIPIFKSTLLLKWRKIFNKTPGDRSTPKNPWEIL